MSSAINSTRLPVSAAVATILASLCLGGMFLTGAWFFPATFAVLFTIGGAELARRTSSPRSLVPVAGLAALLVYLVLRYAHDEAYFWVIPNREALERLHAPGRVGSRRHQPLRRTHRGVPRHRVPRRCRRRPGRSGGRHPRRDDAPGRARRSGPAGALHRADHGRPRRRRVGGLRTRRHRLSHPAAGRGSRAGQPLGSADALHGAASELPARGRDGAAGAGGPPGRCCRARTRTRRTRGAARHQRRDVRLHAARASAAATAAASRSRSSTRS